MFCFRAFFVVIFLVSVTAFADPPLAYLLSQLRAYPAFPGEELPFGVEIEGTFPSPDLYEGQMRKATAIADKSFRRMGLLNTLPSSVSDRDNKIIFSCSYPDTEHRGEWILKTEDLLTYNIFRGGVEVVTPVFERLHSLYYLNELLADLYRGGFRRAPEKGGLHVHVGLPNPNSRQALVVGGMYMAILAQIEGPLKWRLGVSERRYLGRIKDLKMTSGYPSRSYPNPPSRPFFDVLTEYLRASDRGIADFLQLEYSLPLAHSWPLPLVRLQKLDSKGTIETIVWNSTLDPEEIWDAVNFTRSLLLKILRQDVGLMTYLEDTAKKRESLSLRKIFNLIEVPAPNYHLTGICRRIRTALWASFFRP